MGSRRCDDCGGTGVSGRSGMEAQCAACGGSGSIAIEPKLPPPPRLPGARVRIVSRVPPRTQTTGRDVSVRVVTAEGNELPLEGVLSVNFSVDARSDVARVVLVMNTFDADVEGTCEGEQATAATEVTYWREEARKATQLAQELQERLEKARHSIPGE